MPTNDFFTIPPTIRRIFESFPLCTLAAERLPARCPEYTPLPSLYVTSTSEDVARGKPSLTPSCLKWQTYLKFYDIAYETVSSFDHATLPYLLPARFTYTTSPAPVPAKRLAAWVRETVLEAQDDPLVQSKLIAEANIDDPLVQVVRTLVETRIRDAWIYATSFEPSVTTLSILYSTSVPIINLFESAMQQKSARAQLEKSRPGGIISGDDIYADADAAFESLATILGNDEWFFGTKDPGQVDAAVFGYTHLILTTEWDPKRAQLRQSLKKHLVLIRHQERIQQRYYPKTVSNS